MVWSALIGAAAGAWGARQANKAAAGLSQKQMDFQERMSSTAYQRAAKDLEAAGLNRILAIGSPSSSPAGSQAPVQDEAAAAIQGALAQAQIKNVNAATAKARAEEKAVLQNINTKKPVEDIAQTVQNVTGDIKKSSSSAYQSAKQGVKGLGQTIATGILDMFMPDADLSSAKSKKEIQDDANRREQQLRANKNHRKDRTHRKPKFRK
jgi:hypothetical protein